MINDCGVTFIDPKNAIYPYSQHKAIWISLDTTRSRTMSNEEVININTILMDQVYSLLGLILDANIKSIQSHRQKHPDDDRYSALYCNISKIDAPDSEHTSILRSRSDVRDVIIPSKYFYFLNERLSEEDAIALRDKCDYKSLAAIDVLQRYDLLPHAFSAKEIIAKSIDYDCLVRLIEWYKDDSENEFDKMSSIVFLEIASDAGNPVSSDRLYRYYDEGKHLREDSDKAHFYFERACEQGSADSLKDFFRDMRKDPEYESKAELYLKIIPEDGSLFLMIARMYRAHGNQEKYLFWLEKAAMTAYSGAVTLWIKFWSNMEPI